MKETANREGKKEAKQMTKYYLRIARYFLSSGILTGFGYTFANLGKSLNAAPLR